jgi:hypothetical protein
MYTKLKLTSIFLTAALFISGCGEAPNLNNVSSSNKNFIYNGHNFGSNRNSDYRQGVVDGCKTSNGNYSKNHALFNLKNDYHAGWEHGRLHCKGKN